MAPHVSPTIARISSIAIAMATLASVATLAWDGVYPPPPSAPLHNGILAEARGWSVVTAFCVAPLGVAALLRARAGSSVAHTVWAGTMAYLVYTFLELAVSGPFTPLFLVYVATLGCAGVGLVAAVATLDREALTDDLGPRAPRRAAAVFSLVVSLGLAAAWMKGIVLRMADGDYGWPDAYGSVAQVVHALDLGLQVPLGLAAGVLLLRRDPAADVVGGIFLVMAATMFPALTGMVAASGLDSGTGVAPAIPFAAASLVALGLAGWFFGAFRTTHRTRDRAVGLTP
jgi:hypothetical protein